MSVQELDSLPPLQDLRPRTVTDQIFEHLYARVVGLDLPPGAKLSEAEVAARMGVSRQPVRDAFYRLSQLGFIQIRPQRATTVTPISTEAVMQAYFIRSALEQATMRVAALTLQPSDWDGLERLIDLQEAASREDRRSDFHALDDQFHRDICGGGQGISSGTWCATTRATWTARAFCRCPTAPRPRSSSIGKSWPPCAPATPRPPQAPCATI